MYQTTRGTSQKTPKIVLLAEIIIIYSGLGLQCVESVVAYFLRGPGENH